MSKLHATILFFAFSAGLAGAPSFATETGKDTVQDLTTLFSAYSEKGANQNILDAAAKRIDFPGMTELLFTPAQWTSLGAAERKHITESFRKLVESRYYPRWQKIFSRSRLAVAGEAKAGNDVYVKTFLTKPGEDESDTVLWRLRPKGNESVVVSLSVNGKDLVSRLRGRFQKGLQKHGPNGLVAWMKGKADSEADY